MIVAGALAFLAIVAFMALTARHHYYVSTKTCPACKKKNTEDRDVFNDGDGFRVFKRTCGDCGETYRFMEDEAGPP